MSLRIYKQDRIWYSESNNMNHRSLYDCDSESDKPSIAYKGEKCYVHESDKTYSWDGSAWNQLGGGGITLDTALLAAYPVGSIYISVVATNPGVLFGVGTWVAFGAGRMMVGIDAADPDFDTAEETGGAKTHTLTEAEMPAHIHDEYTNTTTTGGLTGWGAARDTSTNTAVLTDYNTGSTGGGLAHSIMNPYIAVYMFKRTL